MNKRTAGWLWIGAILLVVVFLVGGGGSWFYKLLLRMHGVHTD
jgi:hypothetical protein